MLIGKNHIRKASLHEIFVEQLNQNSNGTTKKITPENKIKK